MSTIYSLDDISTHCKKDDIWMTIHNKVYNITAFMNEHPGGEEVLMDEAGNDATEAFEHLGHSDVAREMLKKYYIGELDIKDHKKTYDFEFKPIIQTKPSSISSLYSLIPALLFGLVIFKLL